jgi:hypothetical protein
MATHRTVPSGSANPSSTRRRRFIVSSMAVRVFIALAISWLIVLAFFVSRVASH